MHVYRMIEEHDHSFCMQHCQKLGGRSPSVRTFEEWTSFFEEAQHIKVKPLRLPRLLWLSATEGDKASNLSRLDHWPEDIDAVEGVWRDYYTGEKLANYTKPWYSASGDNKRGSTFNCLNYYPNQPARFASSWLEWQCLNDNMGCPCGYQQQPILHLRGVCSATDLEKHSSYTPMQLSRDPTDVSMVGRLYSRIIYSTEHWTIRSLFYDAEARSDARTPRTISFATGGACCLHH